MNKQIIAFAAALMVLTGSVAFAANGTPNTQMPMNQNAYMQHNGNYNQNGMHGQQHMYQLSDQAKTNSTSMWDSVCNFFGTHGGHNSHGGYGGHNGGHNGGGRHM